MNRQQTDLLKTNVEQPGRVSISLDEGYMSQPMDQRLIPAIWNGQAIRIGVQNKRPEEMPTILIFFGEGDDQYSPFTLPYGKTQGTLANITKGKLLTLGSYHFDYGTQTLELDLAQNEPLAA